MTSVRQSVVGLVVFLTVALVVGLVVVGVVWVVAIGSPIAGLVYLWRRLAAAKRFWTSRGVLTLPDGSIQVIGTGRARSFAALEAVSGLGGLLLSLALPALVFNRYPWVIPAVIGGVGLNALGRSGRRRLLHDEAPTD